MRSCSLDVGVVGAGTMGVGIAITVARAGHRVVLHDTTAERAEAGAEDVARFLDGSVQRGKLESEQRDTALRGLRPTAVIDDLRDCQVVIEAVYEDLEVKMRLLAELDDVCAGGTLFHTNTSTLSVASIAAGSRVPRRVVGTHYCNPAPLMKLVEVVRALLTGNDELTRTVEFVRSLGKVPVLARDTPGFLVNYFLVPFENDCIRALEAGMGSVESIDLAVTGGLGYPMGTFRLLDIVGLDIHYAVSTSLYEQLHDPRFAPPPLVTRMISAGRLGRKVGRGFYSYRQEALV